MKPPKTLKVRLVRRRTFTEEDYWRIIFFRFGSLEHFDNPVATLAEVSKRTGIHVDTIRKFLLRFEDDGNQIFLRRKYNGGYNKKITFELEE